MARYLTPAVTVVQGDDAPDIVVSLTQDSSGLPYVLSDRKAYAVIVDMADQKNYVHKFECAIDNANDGKVRISWIKDPVELTSYLDDLIPGKRYEIQIFLGRTNLPPSYIDVSSFYGYFGGRYYYTGAEQEGSPVFKHEAEDLFLSRSTYSDANPGDYAWLVTSLQPATWEQVKNQNKNNLGPSDLETTPIWNYRQINTGDAVAANSLYPKLEAFEPDGTFLITPEEKAETQMEEYPAEVTINGVGQGFDGVLPFYTFNVKASYYREDEDVVGSVNWRDTPPRRWEYSTTDGAYANDIDTPNPPREGEGEWYALSSFGDGPPTVSYDDLTWVQYFTPTDVADLPTDIENRGTQTVLTHVPLIVKQAYRLNEN